MNYKDIPKFTAYPNYRVNVPLDSLIDTLKHYKVSQIRNGYELQLNPDFQRGHVWTEEQQIAFVEFLLKGGITGREIYFNQSNWMSTFEGDMFLVDGLQRITACIRFLNDEIPVFGHYYSQIEGKLSSDICFYFNVNDLKTKKEVLKWYLEMNTGGTIHTKEEIDRVTKMYENEKN